MGPQVTQAEATVNVLGWGGVGVVLGAEVLSPDGHVSVLGLAWLGTALQWCLGDSWHGLVHQNLLVLHFLTCATHKTHRTAHHSVRMTRFYGVRLNNMYMLASSAWWTRCRPRFY